MDVPFSSKYPLASHSSQFPVGTVEFIATPGAASSRALPVLENYTIPSTSIAVTLGLLLRPLMAPSGNDAAIIGTKWNVWLMSPPVPRTNDWSAGPG